MSDVAERVKKIVIEHLGVDADKVTDDANFIEDLGADSLDTVELVMAFEEEFASKFRMMRLSPLSRSATRFASSTRQRLRADLSVAAARYGSSGGIFPNFPPCRLRFASPARRWNRNHAGRAPGGVDDLRCAEW